MKVQEKQKLELELRPSPSDIVFVAHCLAFVCSGIQSRRTSRSGHQAASVSSILHGIGHLARDKRMPRNCGSPQKDRQCNLNMQAETSFVFRLPNADSRKEKDRI